MTSASTPASASDLLTRWTEAVQSANRALDEAPPQLRKAWLEAVRTSSEVVVALTEAALCERVATTAWQHARELEAGLANGVRPDLKIIDE